MKKSVIFDLDGTLLYTLGDITYATNAALVEFGYPVRYEEEFRYFVGNGAVNQIRKAMPEGAIEDEIMRVHARYLEIYTAHSLDFTYAYDGIPETVRKLKEDGFTLAVASNKPHERTKEIIKHFFPDTFDVIMGKNESMPLKPDPAIIYAVLGLLKAPKEGVFYVGDTGTDVKTAKNAGIPCAGALWGFRTREELEKAGADVLCEDPAELYKAIRSYYSDIE